MQFSVKYDRLSSKYNLICPKGPCGTIFWLEIQVDPPKSPLRDDFPLQNTIQIRLRACRRPSILSPVKPLRHQTFETPFRRFDRVPIPGGGPKGTQGNPRVPKGTEGRLRRPWGGWAHGAPWGYTEAIPNGTPFRLEGIYEGKAITSVRKPFEWKGRSEWMALPNGKLCHVFTQPRKRRTECRRIWLDFDGFEWIWMDLIDYIETKMIPKLTI